MEAFQHQLALWSGFFGATAQVSGALVGLVFVALTFNPKALGAEGDPMLRLLARQTFGDFVKALGVSLSMLVPFNGPAGLGFALVFIAGVDTVQLVRRVLAVRKQGYRKRPEVTRRLLLTLFANLDLIAAGSAFLALPPSAMLGWSLLFGGMILLLVSGCRSAWLLLVEEQDP